MLPFFHSTFPTMILRMTLSTILLAGLPGYQSRYPVRAAPNPPLPGAIFLPLMIRNTAAPEGPPLTSGELEQVRTAGEPAGELAALALGRRIQVNTFADEQDLDGNCSLREAVQAANSDLPVDACRAGRGFDAIIVPSGTYSLTLDELGFEDENAWGDLDLHDNAVIFGKGFGPAVISGNHSDRPLEVFPGVKTVLFHITLTAGKFSYADITGDDDYERARGGGLRNAGLAMLALSRVDRNSVISEAGGIYNTGTLGLFNATVNGNDASLGGAAGLYNTGKVFGLNVHLDNNQSAEGDGGAIYSSGVVVLGKAVLSGNGANVYDSFGGTIYNGGEMSLTETLVDGGLALVGGAIYNGGSLTLNMVKVTHGSTRGTSGGAIYNEGQLKFRNGAILDNDAVGLVNFATAGLHEVLISDNLAYASYGEGVGGGIQNWGVITMTQSTVANNYAEQQGGGIHNRGSLWIFSSTIADNFVVGQYDRSGSGRGGGIYSTTPVTLVNVTISGNRAGRMGGGIYLENGHSFLSSVDVVSNTVLAGDGGGMVITGTAVANLRGSLIAGNFDLGSPPFAPDCLSLPRAILSLGYNLLGDSSGCDWTAAVGDQIGTASDPIDPLIAPLSGNGGPTWTHALLPGSPAIDTAGTVCPPYDQRGVPRPQGPACDIGAYEKE